MTRTVRVTGDIPKGAYDDIAEYAATQHTGVFNVIYRGFEMFMAQAALEAQKEDAMSAEGAEGDTTTTGGDDEV